MGQPSQQRILVAQSAARLLAEGAEQDYAAARRKAASRLGITGKHNLPDNEEIEAALRDYQQLFQPHSQEQALRQLRETAQKAIQLLSPFSPRLVGAVLSGTADSYSPIELHLFANTSEEVGIFLMEHKIPYQEGEQWVHYAKGCEEHRPMFSFLAGDDALELTIFPPKGLHQAPLSPITGKSMERCSLKCLQQLLAGTSTAS